MGFIGDGTHTIKHRLQEDHRKIVEDEDAYFGEEVDDDRPDGNFVQSTVILFEIVCLVSICVILWI
jgi:hypothetical protein